MSGFAACLQARSACVREFWGLRALRMCVHAGLVAGCVCLLGACAAGVREFAHSGGAAGYVSVSVGGLCVQVRGFAGCTGG